MPQKVADEDGAWRLSLLLVGAATLYRTEWSYPAFMIALGAHYLPLVTLYRMRMFYALAAVLVVAIINPYGEMTTGRDAVQSTFAALFEGTVRGSTHISRIRCVHFVGPDLALFDAEAVISDFGPARETLRHDFTDVLVRTPEGWRTDDVRAYMFIPRPEG